MPAEAPWYWHRHGRNCELVHKPEAFWARVEGTGDMPFMRQQPQLQSAIHCWAASTASRALDRKCNDSHCASTAQATSFQACSQKPRGAFRTAATTMRTCSDSFSTPPPHGASQILHACASTTSMRLALWAPPHADTYKSATSRPCHATTRAPSVLGRFCGLAL